MENFKIVNGIVTTVGDLSIVEVIMYSIYDKQLGEYYMELATLSDLQEDVFLTLKDRSEAYDDELGKEYSYIVKNFTSKDLSLEFILEYYHDSEYIVIEHDTIKIGHKIDFGFEYNMKGSE